MRKLIDETDRAAGQFLRQVGLIRVIGYSFHDHNGQRLNRLLAGATGGIAVQAAVHPVKRDRQAGPREPTLATV